MQKYKRSCFLFLTFFISVNTRSLCQEYIYDSSGNLSVDATKQIAFIHYNFMNLTDTIVYSDGRKIIYTYTAAGKKLSEQSILANGAVKQKRDYADIILYQNDTLQEIRHEDGRTVPVSPGNYDTSWEHQYHLIDHLGNVRSTLTSKAEVDISTADFETAKAISERSKFSGYDNARRINSILFDHTRSGTTHYSQRLNGSVNEKYGIAKSLSVMPGDTIKLVAYAKYADPNTNHWTTALTTLMTQVASGSAGTVIDGAGYSTAGNAPFPFAGLNGTSGSTGNGPKAYLNWLVFDRNYILKTGGYVKMSDVAKENGSDIAHEKLSSQLIIKEPGYVYVYLSNEETTPLDVYFDDVAITQVKGPLIQQQDYDPFGLTFNEYISEEAALNSFLYNGKELQRDFDLNWYDYGARMYDAALGRWHMIDPKAEKYRSWSPYNYVMNNPVKFVDPDGREVGHYSDSYTPDYDTHNKDLMKATPEGNRIVTEAESDAGASIIIAFDKKGNIHSGDATAIRLGHNKIWYDKEDGKIVNARIESQMLPPNFEKFQGMNVTKEVNDGKEIYLVVVPDSKNSNQKAINAAAAIEAGINLKRTSRKADIEKMMKECNCSQKQAMRKIADAVLMRLSVQMQNANIVKEYQFGKVKHP
jgi:RHS repeat-associated protein